MKLTPNAGKTSANASRLVLEITSDLMKKVARVFLSQSLTVVANANYFRHSRENRSNLDLISAKEKRTKTIHLTQNKVW